MPNLAQCITLALLFLICCFFVPLPLMFGFGTVSITWSLTSVGLTVNGSTEGIRQC